MSAPQRVQRKRVKGWRAPEGAVYVGRGSKWGNSWKIGEPLPWGDHHPMTAREAVTVYQYGIHPEIVSAELVGSDLMCWCPLEQPCHADVLLALANPPDHQCDGEESWCWPCEYRERFRDPSQTSTLVNVLVAERGSPPTAQSRAEKIADAIVPDQLDQYLGAGECDLHDVCRDGKRQCPYHQALAAGPSSPSTFPSDGA